MYEKAKNRWFKHLDFMILDLIMIYIAFRISIYVRTSGIIMQFTPVTKLYSQMSWIVVFLDLVLVLILPLHSNILKRKHVQELFETLKNTTSIVLMMNLYLYFMQQAFYFSRAIFVLFWALSTMLVFIERSCYKVFLRKVLLKNGKLVQTVLFTEEKNLKETAARLMRHCENRFTLVGIVLDDYDESKKDEYEAIMKDAAVPSFCKLIGNCNDFFNLIVDQVVDEAIIDIDPVEKSEKLTNLLLELGIAVHINLVRTYGDLPNQMVGRVGGLTVMTTSQNMASPVGLMVKRLMDIAGSLVGLTITAVAVLIFGPIIYLQSPGNIFYSQTRVGRHGRKFKIWKLRSMYPDADKRLKELEDKNEMSGFMFKMENDPRIIPIGHFIRKCSIDELPQFYNILKGDMSLVGTRPPTEEEWEKYEMHHRARLSFRPGLTGNWQVSGRSSITDFEEVVNLDMKYIRDWTIWLDIKILFKTVYVVLKSEGAH